MRPTYETLDNLRAQQEAIAVVESRWQCVAIKLKAFSEIDYALCRNNSIQAWAEVKSRTNDSTKYADYMLSLHKWREGIQQAELTGLPFYLIVRFTDRVMVVRGDRTYGVRYGVGGREDRGDPNDIEPVVFIPMRYFTIIA